MSTEFEDKLAEQKNVLGEQDRILQYINSHYVSIPEDDQKLYKVHLACVMNTMEGKMKEDEFFDAVYQKQHVCGSFWDGLKVGKADEFDINLILKLPIELQIQVAQYRSYVEIKEADGAIEKLKKNPAKWKKYKKIQDWIDPRGFFITDKIRSTLESIITKALTKLDHCPTSKALRKLDESRDEYFFTRNKVVYTLKLEKNGPAMTLTVHVSPGEINFSIDMVPAFEFTSLDKLPWKVSERKLQSISGEKAWYVVPKPFKLKDGRQINTNDCVKRRSWRLSFHDHESELIHGTYHLKPVLKLLKKLRDNHKLYSLSSYSIKTVFLWTKDKNSPEFWQEKQLSYVFLYMLREVLEFAKKKIPLYWDKKACLLENMEQSPYEKLIENLNKIYQKIQNRIQDDKYIIAKLLFASLVVESLRSIECLSSMVCRILREWMM